MSRSANASKQSSHVPATRTYKVFFSKVYSSPHNISLFNSKSKRSFVQLMVLSRQKNRMEVPMAVLAIPECLFFLEMAKVYPGASHAPVWTSLLTLYKEGQFFHLLDLSKQSTISPMSVSSKPPNLSGYVSVSTRTRWRYLKTRYDATNVFLEISALFPAPSSHGAWMYKSLSALCHASSQHCGFETTLLSLHG